MQQLISSTYRLQLNKNFPLSEVVNCATYFKQLGVSALYLSPLLKARKGSLHGYDITAHDELNPELGSEADLQQLAEFLNRSQMSILADIVPNHMYVFDPENAWWNDVLENGPSSPYAIFFDIDWTPPKENLHNKILLPLLGDQYGKVLENQQIQIIYEDQSFWARYYDLRFPLAPKSWSRIFLPILKKLKQNLSEDDLRIMEIESILTALGHLPARTETDPEKLKERQREKEIIRRRASELLQKYPELCQELESTLKDLNGWVGDSRSFDTLEALLDEQAYRLCYWRVAAEEINYRRFFDVNELAAIRMEDPKVFEATHKKILEWISKNWIQAFRIDHVDGLYDPAQYLENLQQAARNVLPEKNISIETNKKPIYTVIEKILHPEEELKSNWAMHGTTGYEFLSRANNVFTDENNFNLVLKSYRKFTGQMERFEDILINAKKFIMLVSMASELHVLASYLDKISDQHRFSRDFTFETLRFALREIIAAFPVYRSYTTKKQLAIDATDRQHILRAVEEAKRRNPATSASIFEFIQSVLLLEYPERLGEEEKLQRQEFIMRFQQFTGPVMAKGMEDTSFYRYFPLAALNEVGGVPEPTPDPLAAFHAFNEKRANTFPHGLSATSTHDTKRSEDVRARLLALSEIPEEWEKHLRKWSQLNRPLKQTIKGNSAPDANDEYLLYQTLLGTWPFQLENLEERRHYAERINNYILKATREAKRRTSWINPNTAYENALTQMIEKLILPSKTQKKFEEKFLPLQKKIEAAGILNSLEMLVLKCLCPGVPDFYQGSELWNFTLVDPDNRNKVDFAQRIKLLESLQKESDWGKISFWQKLLNQPQDGKIKLALTKALLRLRAQETDLLMHGSYRALEVSGPKKKHIIAFERNLGKKSLIVILPRFFLHLNAEGTWQSQPEFWRHTTIQLGGIFPGKYREFFTQEIFNFDNFQNHALQLSADQTFDPFPFFILFPLGEPPA